MKTKIFLSSILTIALCLSLIVGSTFALFETEKTVNIAVTAGKLDVSAHILDTIVKKLSYGDANYNKDTNELTITKIVPGDEVVFEIEIANNSSIPFNYEISATSAGKGGVNLLDALECKVELGDGWDAIIMKKGTNGFTTGTIQPVNGKVELPSKVKVTLTFPVFSFSGDVNSVEYKEAYETYQSYQGAETSIAFTVTATQVDNATTNP